MGNLRIGNGLVHVYTGHGKGKTAAALGLALRAIGWGARVCVVQFIKGYADVGEARFASELPDRLVVKQFALDTSPGIDERKAKARAKEAEAALEWAESAVAGRAYDVVVLDEINNALHYGLVSLDRVLALVRNRPPGVELVLTGRNAPEQIVEAADYVTEMQAVKHPFEHGARARRGIEY